MGFYTKSGEIDEAAWIKTYMDLAGVTESAARSVFMYVACKETMNTEDECENAVGRTHPLAKPPVILNYSTKPLLPTLSLATKIPRSSQGRHHQLEDLPLRNVENYERTCDYNDAALAAEICESSAGA